MIIAFPNLAALSRNPLNRIKNKSYKLLMTFIKAGTMHDNDNVDVYEMLYNKTIIIIINN